MVWWKRSSEEKTDKIPTQEDIASLSSQFAAQFVGLNIIEQVNIDNDIVESFSKKHNCITSVFVKSGNEFIRIATTLKQRDGTSAKGTSLDHFNPAYAKIQNGESYSGSINLFGTEYLTKYDPIFDNHKQVIGILFVGLPWKSYRYLKENPW
ncbi:MAG: Cache 3/Cache 2 fusion domain-containing protein [Gammaproteobacteria bacterium]|jgi:methyl-accepting chemotaxis protein-2 (aspartate sensor receptor)